jgi:cytochrome oxidase Cu insertion factor (SCO1/SenC/PrrC family)
MTPGEAGPARFVSGRRLVLIAAVLSIALSAAAALTARQAWHALYHPAAASLALDGAMVLPPHTRRPPPLGLPDQNGQVFHFRAQVGKTVLVTFMDSACTSLCPVEGRELADVRTELPVDAPVELVVVSTSLRDTPASARAFAARMGWDGRWNWHWLFGSPSRLAQVWRAYGITVTSADVHTSALYLVDRDGYERAGLGVPGPQQELVADLRQLSGS